MLKQVLLFLTIIILILSGVFAWNLQYKQAEIPDSPQNPRYFSITSPVTAESIVLGSSVEVRGVIAGLSDGVHRIKLVDSSAAVLLDESIAIAVDAQNVESEWTKKIKVPASANEGEARLSIHFESAQDESQDFESAIVIYLSKAAVSQKLEGNWKLTSVIDVNNYPFSVHEDQSPSLVFEQGKVSGRSFCNSFNTLFTLGAKNQITFDGVSSTKMACVDNVKMQLESDQFRAFSETTSYLINELSELRFFNDKGIVLSTYIRP